MFHVAGIFGAGVLLGHDGVDGGRLMSWGQNNHGQVNKQMNTCMHIHLQMMQCPSVL